MELEIFFDTSTNFHSQFPEFLEFFIWSLIRLHINLFAQIIFSILSIINTELRLLAYVLYSTFLKQLDTPWLILPIYFCFVYSTLRFCLTSRLDDFQVLFRVFRCETIFEHGVMRQARWQNVFVYFT